MLLRGIILLTAAAALCLACGPSDSRAVLLRFNAKPGDFYVLEYETTTRMVQQPNPQSAPIDDRSTITVLRRFDCKSATDASSTWEFRTEKADGTGTGSMAVQAASIVESERKKKPETIVRDERNLVKGEERMSPLELEFPIQEVRVGDAWRSEARQYGAKLRMLYKIDKFEKVDGKDAVLIAGDLEVPDGIRFTKPVQAWFEVDTGRLIRGECEIYVEQGDAKVTTTLRVERK